MCHFAAVENEAKAAATVSVKYQGYKKPITTDLDVAVASMANGAPAVPLHRSVTNPAAMNRALMQQAQLANQRYQGTHQHHNDAQPLNRPHNHLPRRQPEPLFRVSADTPKTAPLACDEEEEDTADADANDTLQRRPKTSPSNGNTSVSIVGGKRITHLELKPVADQQNKSVRRRASVAAVAREVVQPRAASPDSCSTSEDEAKKNGSGSVSSTSSEDETEQNKTQECIVPHSQSLLSEGITLINSNRNSYQSDYDNPSSNSHNMSNSFMSNQSRSQLRNSVTYHQKPLEKAPTDPSPAPLPRGGTNGLQHYNTDSLYRFV
ncbi:hypothetical protein Ciccas_003538 [Cichlidogyrus casuarinus]|uniref:Uncharacterized protein n=1 Tax=Cichlidogyrus casuarinus TaxID=1844966 RepID=A0ABD2QE27_9PLAT